MKNIVEDYGRNAGKIWRALNANGSLPQTRLIRDTKLKNDEFYSAIGWLARENKINRQNMEKNPTYRLGETNLTPKIGEDAGRVWRTLHTLGKNDVASIAKHVQIQTNDVHAALGWLAREDKIDVNCGKDQQLTVRLKNTSPMGKNK
jgi:hypothetical protein